MQKAGRGARAATPAGRRVCVGAGAEEHRAVDHRRKLRIQDSCCEIGLRRERGASDVAQNRKTTTTMLEAMPTMQPIWLHALSRAAQVLSK